MGVEQMGVEDKVYDLMTKLLGDRKGFIFAVLFFITPIAVAFTGYQLFTLKKLVMIEVEVSQNIYDFEIGMLARDLKDLRTFQEVDDVIEYWQEADYGAQLTAVQIVQKNYYAQNRLKKLLFNDEVFKAVLTAKAD